MADIRQPQRAVLARVLEGDGFATHAQRRAAFANQGLEEPLRTLVAKVASRSHTVTDEDVARARSAGLREDQIFEIAVCAAVGEATRQWESALAALDASGEG
jgi:alkylhydroperoxidase family enzyme